VPRRRIVRRRGGAYAFFVLLAILFFEITVFVLILRSSWSGRTKAIACSIWTVFLMVLLISGAASPHPASVAQSTNQTSPTTEAIASLTTVAASRAPTPTPSAAPPVPSPIPAAPAQTAVSFVNAPITAARGLNATLQVKTDPNTSCSIVVNYKSGPSTAAGLGAKTSDGAGNVSWTWKVGGNTTPGSWPITVTCGNGSAQTYITVTLE
jgi:hypothetical protein